MKNIARILVAGCLVGTGTLWAQADDEHTIGSWETQVNITWPGNNSGGVAHHAVLLDDGTVLCVDTAVGSNPRAFVFDPSNNTYAATTLPSGVDRLMCSANCHLPDGRVIFAGGADNDDSGIASVVVFSRVSGANSWQAIDLLQYAGDIAPRWYPTLTALPNGNVILLGGTPTLDHILPCYSCPGADCDGSTLSSAALLPVILKPNESSGSQQQWLDSQDSEGAYKAGREQWWCPFNFVLTNGRVFSCGSLYRGIGTCSSRPRVSATLHTSQQTWSNVSSSLPFDAATAVMYRPDKVLKAGAGEANEPEGAGGMVYVTNDAKASSPTWTQVDAGAFDARSDCQALVLPDGKVLIIGGTSSHLEGDPRQASPGV